MGICRYCHQQAGWFKDAHNVCEQNARKAQAENDQKLNAAIESVKKCMADAVIEGKHYSDVSATIDKLTADAAILKYQVHAALKEGWSQGAEELSKAHPISDEECLASMDLYKAAGLTDEEMYYKTAGAHALFWSNRTWTVLHDRIRPFKAPSEPLPDVAGSIGMFNPASFNLQAGEVRVWGLGNVVLKQAVTTTAYVGSHSGVSIRVASGLWYRFGGLRGHKEESTFLQDVDEGEVLISTRAIYFSGRATGGSGINFKLPFNQIIQFKPYSDAVGICKNGAREQIFAPRYMVWSDGVISGPNDIGFYLFNLLQALAAKDSAAHPARS